MSHKCINFINRYGICEKCRKPEWALFFSVYKHEIGDKVTLPKNFTNGGKVFTILKKERLGYTISNYECGAIEFFEWWELYPLKQTEKGKEDE